MKQASRQRCFCDLTKSFTITGAEPNGRSASSTASIRSPPSSRSQTVRGVTSRMTSYDSGRWWQWTYASGSLISRTPTAASAPCSAAYRSGRSIQPR